MLLAISRIMSNKTTMMASSQVALVTLLLLVLVDNKSHQAVLPNQLASSSQPNSPDPSQISSSPSSSSPLATAGPNGLPKPEQSSSASVATSVASIATAEMGSQMSNSIGSINQTPQHQAPAPQPIGMSQQVSSLVPSSVVQTPQLSIWPKVNIFASSAEVKKLLGLPTQIDYIANGVPNTYALGFQIPMGFALSDMIFTWQNLGPTNVNYSISLSIGNVDAVLRPSINITRTGLIPRHEQVFKITLPCSGRIIDEVDVQVLINITGLVPVTSNPHQQQLESDAVYGNSDDSELQLTRAVQQQNEMLAAAAAQLNAQPIATDQMQADQSGGDQSSGPFKRPQMRMVSHQLAIKRKKICTIERVPVVIKPPDVKPPNQKPGRDIEQSTPKPDQSPPTIQQQAPLEKQPPTIARGYQQPVATPEHSPIWTEAPIGHMDGGGHTLTPQPPPGKIGTGQLKQQQPQQQQQQQQPVQVNPSSNLIPRPPLLDSNWPQVSPAAQAPKTTNSAEATNSPPFDPLRHQPNTANANSPLLFSLIVMSLIVSMALIALLVLGSASSSSPTGYGRGPLDKLSALTNCICRRTGARSPAAAKCTKNVGPLTIKSGLIGTFGTGMTRERTSTTGHHHHHHLHHHHSANGLKSNVSSISGLSTISGLESKHHHLNSLMGPYCQSKQQLQGAGYNTGFYHHYQQPPDLLIGAIGNNNTTTSNAANGFHHSPITSPYQITMSNSQMTKLFLSNPTNSGTYSVDNNYMPITTTTSSNGSGNGHQMAPQSDSGSVYQTIY